MTPLPIFLGDACGSLLGVMLFPDDLPRAASYAAQLLTHGPVQDYLRAGHDLSRERKIGLFDALSTSAPDREVESRKVRGRRVGEVVKALWALICGREAAASWESAIAVAENQATIDGFKWGRATFRADLSEMRKALHFWGAFALRDYRLHADPAVGYSGLDDIGALMTEALILRQQLCTWRDSRGRADESYLAGNWFGPWVGWQPHEPRPGWPDTTGRLPCVSLPADRVPTRRSPGRPRKPRPTNL